MDNKPSPPPPPPDQERPQAVEGVNLETTVAEEKLMQERIEASEKFESEMQIRGIYPDTEISILTSEGSSGYIFTNEEGDRVYKVIIDRRNMNDTDMMEKLRDYADKEVRNIKVLSEIGLGPKFYAHHRTNNPDIIVMERLDFSESIPSDLSNEEVEAEIERVQNLLVEAGLYPNDVEFVWDKTRGQIMVIDAGGFSNFEEYKRWLPPPRKPDEPDTRDLVTTEEFHTAIKQKSRRMLQSLVS